MKQTQPKRYACDQCGKESDDLTGWLLRGTESGDIELVCGECKEAE